MSSQERWKALGNKAVNLKADAGREAHPQGCEAWQQKVRNLIKQLPMILRIVAAVWPLFPRLPPGLLRYKSAKGPKAAKGRRHLWMPEQAGWC